MNFLDIIFGSLRFIMNTLKILFFPALIVFGLIYKFRGIVRFRWVPRTKEVKIKGKMEQREYLDYEIEFTAPFQGDKITQLSTLEILIIFIVITILLRKYT